MTSLCQLESGKEASAVRDIEVEGIDRETLLVNWLNEILYLEQTCSEIYDRFRISEASDNHLHARLYGQASGTTASHIKAATLHDLEVRQTAEGFEATVMLDV
jgi:SHS2 domain-containing protein